MLQMLPTFILQAETNNAAHDHPYYTITQVTGRPVCEMGES